MVNVNKNIEPGKQAKSSTKTKPQAPARRPRNTALNSSARPASVTHGETHASEQNPFKAKLNCSRNLNCSVTGNITSDVYDKLYTREDDPQKVADVLGCTVEDVKEIDSETEDLGYGRTVGYLLAKPEYEEELGQNGIEILSILEDGTVGMMIGRGFHTVETDLNLVLDRIDGEDIDSACGRKDTANSSLNCEVGSAKVSGTVTIYNDFADLDNDTTERLLRSRIEKAVPGAKVDFEKVNDTDVKVKINCPDADAEKARLAVESSDVTKSVDWEPATEEIDSAKNVDKTAESTKLNSSTEPEGDADGGESVGEGVDATDIKITTESGNEVSMQDIKIVQNPDTNELAIFIPEDEDEAIPEGFSVIGMVVPDMVDSVPAIEGADDGGELDSSKKKNELNCSSISGLLEVATEYYEDEHGALIDILQSVGDLGYGDAVYEQLIKNYGYEGTDAQQADEALIKMASEDAAEHDFLVSLIQAIEDLGYGKQVYTDVLGLGGNIDSSVNSSLGGGDDRQDATSQVTVPKSFPDDKIYDLYRWVETELLHEGIDVDVYSVGRPSASTISFEFEVTGRDPAEVDAIIEDRVVEFINNGNNAIQYPKGDPRSELNSAKQEKNLNCTVDNAHVEQTEQGTWVVRADTDRFGENAILYEHYSEEGANKYLDRLKAGGDAVANGYSGHIDPKKVDLDSSDGTTTAKLDKASISKAMAKVILEDKDTPLVYIKMKDGALVYLQPAGYEDNQLVSDGNFDDAKIYVAMYDKNFKPIRVDGKVDNKMNGSEVVDYIKRNLGM